MRMAQVKHLSAGAVIRKAEGGRAAEISFAAPG
jgi:hypothetical protein